MRAKRVIVANNYTVDLIKKSFQLDPKKIFMVNPGASDSDKIDEQFISALKNKHNLNDRIVLLTLGRLVKRKGVDNVISALASASKIIDNLFYVVAGSGPDKTYLQARAKGLPNVIFLDAITPAEKNAWLAICDIFVMTARNLDGDFEGFGIVHLEANLHAKPVVAGRSGGVADAVIDNFNGLLVDPENINDIADAIIRLARDASLRAKLGAQGKARAQSEFSWPGQINKIYRCIIN